MAQKQQERAWRYHSSLWFLHAQQEMDPGGGVQQSHDEVQSGNSELNLVH